MKEQKNPEILNFRALLCRVDRDQHKVGPKFMCLLQSYMQGFFSIYCRFKYNKYLFFFSPLKLYIYIVKNECCPLTIQAVMCNFQYRFNYLFAFTTAVFCFILFCTAVCQNPSIIQIFPIQNCHNSLCLEQSPANEMLTQLKVLDR